MVTKGETEGQKSWEAEIDIFPLLLYKIDD